MCTDRDNCTCANWPSKLPEKYPIVKRQHPEEGAVTGWAGTDCSIPVCTQGFWDPYCTEITEGGEGCYRCPNGGNCTAPDTCACASEEWSGFDCRTRAFLLLCWGRGI